ncbi:MAG: hypothetical protein ACI9J5_003654, partial [Paraglaciecola sp.]
SGDAHNSGLNIYLYRTGMSGEHSGKRSGNRAYQVN